MSIAAVNGIDLALPTRRAGLNDAVLGMRGISIVLIALTHYLPTAVFSFNIARPLISFMLVATGFFFAAQLQNEPALASERMGERFSGLGRALLHRHKRIWPPLAIVICGYLVLAAFDGGELTAQIFQTWPLYLTYFGNIPKYLFEGQAFPSHFWLISAQEQVMAVVGLTAAMLGGKRLSSLFVPMLAIGVASRVIGALIFMPVHAALALDTPFAVTDSIGIGFLIHRALLVRHDRRSLRRQLGAFGIGGLAIWVTLPNVNAIYFGLLPFIAAIWGAFFVVLLSDPLRAPGFASTLFCWPPLVQCGRIALSFFLVHPLVNTTLILVYPIVFGELIPWPTYLLISPTIAFLAASAFFRLVESPVRDHRGSRRRPPAAEVRV